MVLSPSWESIRSHSPPMDLNKTICILRAFILYNIQDNFYFIEGVYGAALMTGRPTFVLICLPHLHAKRDIIKDGRGYYASLAIILLSSHILP